MLPSTAASKAARIRGVIGDGANGCAHEEGLEFSSSAVYRCPVCGVGLDAAGVERWVREAEKERDEAYSLVEGEGFGEIALQELQREVYRRRKVLYGLQEAPRAVSRPEMVLVVYEERRGVYECSVYYESPRSAWDTKRFSVEAAGRKISGLRSSTDLVARLVGEKVGEFHEARRELRDEGLHPPARRVFYASEL